MATTADIDTKDEKLASLDHDYAAGDMEMESDRALLRRIDWRILPIMFLTYFLQFLDKVSLNYANIMGLQKDLGMQGNDFSWLATAFYIAYAVAEVPQGILLQKYPVTKVLGVNVLVWGILLCCSAAAQNYAGIMALRTILGIMEAVIAPSLTIYTSMWYTRAESTPRFGLWYCGLGVGQIIGGLISFGAQHAPLNGWRIMFGVIGAVNVLVAALVLFILPETPEKATFLTPTDKARIKTRLEAESAGVGEKVFKWTALLQVFGDAQTWLLILLTLLITIPSGVITTFSSILIQGFGYSSKESALLNMPSGIVSIVSTMVSSYGIARGYSRWLTIDILLIPTLLGSCLMSFLPTRNQAGCLAGIYMVNTTVAPLALIFAWTGANYKGYTMKVAGSTLISAAFSVANIIGPQTFQAKDAPGYTPAKITLVAVNAAAIVVSTSLRVLYGRRNARAERVGGPARSRMERKIEDKRRGEIMADEQDGSAFRYVYYKMLILITGANGFIASHCIAQILQTTDHHIRCTVRSGSKATETLHALHTLAGIPTSKTTTHLHLVVIPDSTDEVQFTPAVAGVDAILHLASAFSYDVRPGEFEEKLLRPAIRGTETVCRVAARERTVKRVVVMSSFAAVYDAALGASPGKVYTEEDWSPLGYEEGRDAGAVPTAYRASKVLAERSAWNFVTANADSVQYKLVTLCPGMVFGRMIHPLDSLASLNASNQIVWDVLRADEIPVTKAPVWIDVEDLAIVSLRALTAPLNGHERFLVAQGAYDTQEIADIVREGIPEFRDRVPVGNPGVRIRDTHYGCDSSKVKRVIGVEFRGLRESVLPLARQLFELEGMEKDKKQKSS
ncbi:MFS general substrate transporter [Aspergillus stella-maris]|uniref:MFS general substrate transporter n=1 Tax=Aspergillus stella-maris TaxID=1810926 RepID=UPI003CCD4978